MSKILLIQKEKVARLDRKRLIKCDQDKINARFTNKQYFADVILDWTTTNESINNKNKKRIILNCSLYQRRLIA
ncbi:hypothetical protein THOE12_50065 [Vibrio rotiferianus]|nr:hypothetical protein THOE12_50065 [Vibrio rotiferianus]